MNTGFLYTQKTPLISDLRRREFGQRVRSLRKLSGLSREQLAQQTRIPFKTIGDIERGEKVSLDVEWVVRPLADFFALQGVTREEFFAAAGLRLDVLQPAETLDHWSEAVAHFYRSTSYPAFVTDPLFTLHSSNAYFNALYGFRPGEALSFWAEGVGLNLIRLLFDPAAGFRQRFGGGAQCRSVLEGSVYSFRVSAVSRLGTPAHDKLMRELERLPDFRDIWNTVSSPSFKPSGCNLPFAFYPDTPDEMRFLCATIFPTRHDQAEQHHILYIPANAATTQRLDHLRTHLRLTVHHYSRRYPQGVREIDLG